MHNSIKNTIIITHIKWNDPDGFDCETCGYHQDHGQKLLLNGKEVFWEESFIGCYGGKFPEIKEAAAYINKIEEVVLDIVLNDEEYFYAFHRMLPKPQAEEFIVSMFTKFKSLEFGDLTLCHQAMQAYMKECFNGYIEIDLKLERGDGD